MAKELGNPKEVYWDIEKKCFIELKDDCLILDAWSHLHKNHELIEIIQANQPCYTYFQSDPDSKPIIFHLYISDDPIEDLEDDYEEVRFNEINLEDVTISECKLTIMLQGT